MASLKVIFSSVRLIPARGGWRVAARDREGEEWVHQQVVEDREVALGLARKVALTGEIDPDRWLGVYRRFGLR